MRTSQKKHYVSARKNNWLITFMEKKSVYCDNTRIPSVGKMQSFNMLKRAVFVLAIGLERANPNDTSFRSLTKPEIVE